MIPNWNGIELLKRFFPSVITAALSYAEKKQSDVEIVIVDDGSTDGSYEWLTEQSARIEKPVEMRVLKNERNMGFGPTCNRGIAAARYPLVFLLNNDVEVDEDAIAPLVENFADENVFAAHCHVFDVESEKVCGTGKLGSFKRGSIRVHQSYAVRQNKTDGTNTQAAKPLYSIFAGGGASMYNRERFVSIGSFDSLLYPIYWEDVEISYRAWKRGLTVLYEPRSIVKHRVSSTMRKENRRKIWMIQQRNRIIYHWINLHDARMFASHVLWMVFLALTSPVAFKPSFLLVCFEALKKLPAIRKRRLEEKTAATRTDRELMKIFQEMKLRDDIKVYDDIAELEGARE
jgi:GT2 family glycosyltransferase